jgi:hypothetical protein
LEILSTPVSEASDFVDIGKDTSTESSVPEVVKREGEHIKNIYKHEIKT